MVGHGAGGLSHDDVIKWKHFSRYWPFVRGIHRFPVNSPHKGQWRGASMFSLICVWINDWMNNREAGDLRRYRSHCDVGVMILWTYDDPVRRFDCDRFIQIKIRQVVSTYLECNLQIAEKFSNMIVTYPFQASSRVELVQCVRTHGFCFIKKYNWLAKRWFDIFWVFACECQTVCHFIKAHYAQLILGIHQNSMNHGGLWLSLLV